MLIEDRIKMVFSSIRSNKMRSFLTMLGIIIGISSVIIIVSVGAGGQSLILNQIESMGSNLLVVFPGASDEKGPPVSAMGITVTSLTNDDLDSLKRKDNVKNLTAISGVVRGSVTTAWKNRQYDTNLTGTTSDFMDVESGEVEKGRFFNEQESKNISMVAVLGKQVADQLFQNENPIGQKIKINKKTFTVIGVMEERGIQAFQNMDNQVLMPLVTAQKIILGINHLSLIRGKFDSVDNIDQVVYEIENTLRGNHNISDPADDDFSVRTQKEMADTFNTITGSLTFFLTAIAALSLVVGGIGIMNIMYITISERTKEIGIRKSVGATNANILSQFLLESVILTFTAGMAGIVAGASISAIIAFAVNYFGYDWDLIVTGSSILMASGISIFIGILFGVLPAYKASRLDPIETLSYE